MNKEHRKKTLEGLQYGDILSWPHRTGGRVYLVVDEVVEGKVNGQLARPYGINGVSVEELLKNPDLEIAEWKKLK